jgi:2-oxo-4-hydroxy-4-carboxy--5-ureidoimidazoline (OHCU) decarboxylase
MGQRRIKMPDFLDIKCLKEETQKKILEEIEKRIAEKKKVGIFTEREIREIEEMRLHPLPDIQDVQSVCENKMFSKER